MEKEKKRMQQLCRKVCNMNGDASKASIYKGFGEWFHGRMGHETRAVRRDFDVVGEGKRGGERGEEEGGISRDFCLDVESSEQKL